MSKGILSSTPTHAIDKCRQPGFRPATPLVGQKDVLAGKVR